MSTDKKIIDEELKEHPPVVEAVGIISEVLSNLGDVRGGIRELLSNAVAKEVGAKRVEVRVYESDKGLAFTVEDDGCGMDYTGDGRGRLDRFLNIAQGKQAGYISDEFGAKGLGTIFLYNSREVVVETWDGGEFWYRVILRNPRKSVLDDKKLSIPLVHKIPAKAPPINRGTKVSVFGWNNMDSVTKDFKLEELEWYLRYHSVVGYTRIETRDTPFPEFAIQVGGARKVLKPGFPYITSDFRDETSRVKTVTFSSINIPKKTVDGKTVKIIVKGGVTTETAKFDLTDYTGGVWLSHNGIPYFRLRANKYARKLGLTDDFVRFVVECDDVRLIMNRSDFSLDEYYDAFEDAIDNAFEKIKNDQSFLEFYSNRRREIRSEIQERMTRKKEEFISSDKRFVWYKDKRLIAEPESEYDVAALLWILEGLGGLPFKEFKTLQYPGYREGVDLLADIQEEPESEKRLCVYAELERFFSHFLKQKHDPRQMSLAICWKVDGLRGKPGKLQKTGKPYKHIYSISDVTISVFEISSFPDIFVGTRSEAEELKKRS